jgi:aminotransferase
MTRLATKHSAINLAQGFPNFPTPDLIKEAAAEAIHADINQYAITWGSKRLRDVLAARYAEWYGMTVDPEADLTVTCGATEAMATVLLAVVDPGDEVVVLEPFYENYGPDAILCSATPIFVPLRPGEPLDLDRLGAACSAKTRAIIINTPNNPAGRVLSRAELTGIAELAQRHDAYVVTDEIYEHILYEGEHIPIATLPGMRERTITISGASKTFSVTGWRIGWIVSRRRTSVVRSARCTIFSRSVPRRRFRRGSRLPSSSFLAPTTRGFPLTIGIVAICSVGHWYRPGLVSSHRRVPITSWPTSPDSVISGMSPTASGSRPR